MDIKLYYHQATRAFRIRWLLEELGLNYTLKQINLFNGECNTEQYKAIHPLGYLPAVEIDGRAMFESGAICLWLSDQFPEQQLAPDFSSPLRMEYTQWMFFVPGDVEPPLFYKLLHSKVLPEQARVKQILPWFDDRYNHVLEALELKLASQLYLLGEQFSTADIMLGSIIKWEPDLLTPYTVLEEYLQRLAARPAFNLALKS